MKLKKMTAVILTFIFIVSLCACQGDTVSPVFNDNGELTVAILCNKDTYDVLNGVDAAIELAKKDAKDNYGITLNTVLYNDEGNYNTSIALASQIADDTQIAAAISVQEFDIVDSVASIFNEAKKPFIIFGGCYDSVSENGYEYFLNDVTSASKMGAVMGEYAKYKRLKKIAAIHTATEFETDEIKGFQSSVSGTDTQICDMLVGPFTREAFESAYSRWTALGIDGIYMCFFDLELGGEVVQMIREKNSDIFVMTDYSIDNENSISNKGKYFNGVSYVPQCPIKESKKLTEFTSRCTRLYGEDDYLSYAAQMYDLLMMTICFAHKNPENGTRLMELFKSEEGYDGVTGHIAFDENGSLIVHENQCKVFNGGKFVLDTNFTKEAAK